jgi:hypothetical protein
MAAYLVGQITVTDRELMGKYIKKVGPMIGRDMVKSCVWGSGGFLGDLDAVLEGDSSDDVG